MMKRIFGWVGFEAPQSPEQTKAGSGKPGSKKSSPVKEVAINVAALRIDNNVLSEREMQTASSVMSALPTINVRARNDFQGIMQHQSNLMHLLERNSRSSNNDNAPQDLSESKHAAEVAIIKTTHAKELEVLRHELANVKLKLAEAERKNAKLEKNNKQYEDALKESDDKLKKLKEKVMAQNSEHQEQAKYLLKEIEATETKNQALLRRNNDLENKVTFLEAQQQILQVENAQLADTEQQGEPAVQDRKLGMYDDGEQLINETDPDATALESPVRGEGQPAKSKRTTDSDAEEKDKKETRTVNQIKEEKRLRENEGRAFLMSSASRSANGGRVLPQQQAAPAAKSQVKKNDFSPLKRKRGPGE